MEYSGRKQGLLPIEAYTSQEWYSWEQELIFGKNWQFVGLIEDTQEPGDYFTVDVGYHPIIVVLGNDYQLKAHHNLCRHRGTELLRSAGKSQKVLVCPYHDWTYSLDGELINVPECKNEFPDLDCSQLGLHKASVETWRGMIFVHPDPDAPPLMEWLCGVEEYLGPHRPEELLEYEQAQTYHEINANWKIVVENYIDAYHLSHLHSETLNMYDHTKIQSGFCGPHFWFNEPLTKQYEQNLEKQTPVPLISHIPREDVRVWVPMIFPNIGLGEAEGTWSTFHIIPASPEKTIVRTRTKMMPATSWEYAKQSFSSWINNSGSSAGKKNSDKEFDPLTSGDFMAEDVYACEQQQKAMSSPRFSVGATARTMERAILDYQQNILNALLPRTGENNGA